MTLEHLMVPIISIKAKRLAVLMSAGVEPLLNSGRRLLLIQEAWQYI